MDGCGLYRGESSYTRCDGCWYDLNPSSLTLLSSPKLIETPIYTYTTQPAPFPNAVSLKDQNRTLSNSQFPLSDPCIFKYLIHSSPFRFLGTTLPKQKDGCHSLSAFKLVLMSVQKVGVCIFKRLGYSSRAMQARRFLFPLSKIY